MQFCHSVSAAGPLGLGRRKCAKNVMVNGTGNKRAQQKGEVEMRKLLLVVGLVAMSTPAMAQSGYIVTTPGQPTTFINRNPIGGGYTVTTPGQPSTFVNPNPYGGGYTVTTPGQPTTFINPTPRFGNRVRFPGE